MFIIIVNELSSILETASEKLLITLLCRASETVSENPVINDQKAVDLVEQLSNHYDFSKLRKTRNFKKFATTMSLRAVNQEDLLLTEEFGEKYTEYVKNSKKLIPFIY